MRIIALSDQHGYLPAVPSCDLLIVAGDICPDWIAKDVTRTPLPGQPWPGQHGLTPARRDAAPQLEWFEKVWLPWRCRQPAGYCVLTWGNHDYCGQLLQSRGGLYTFGTDTVAVVDALVYCAGLRLWCTPWSSQFRDWAWMASEGALVAKYAPIPPGLDILVSHQPPYGSCDWGDTDGHRAHLGSEALLDVVEFKRPKAVVCGHLHGGHGEANLNVEYDQWKVSVYNVAVLDEQYRPAHVPTVIEL